MHYGDKEQLTNNTLIIGIYKHSTEIEDEFEYELASIVRCIHFSPYILNKLLVAPTKMLEKFQSMVELEAEEWYLVELVQTEFDKFEIVKTTNTTRNENPFFRLH